VLELGVKTLLAYLLGSLVGSLVVGSLRGVDIRRLGSGNAGGTNALRTQGWLFAAAVVVIDVGKALLAVGWLPPLELPVVGIDPRLDREWLAVACAVAVVVGHVYPVWYEFRGGKGAATLLGAVAVLAPTALLPVVLGYMIGDIKTHGGDWNSVIYFVAVIYFLGAVCWLAVNPNDRPPGETQN
jgi:glycerol-3-phosphate acyltransferase PlsY